MKRYVRDQALPFVTIDKQPFPVSHYYGTGNSNAVDKSQSMSNQFSKISTHVAIAAIRVVLDQLHLISVPLLIIEAWPHS
jgi:hypothetical protein